MLCILKLKGKPKEKPHVHGMVLVDYPSLDFISVDLWHYNSIPNNYSISSTATCVEF